MIPKKGDLRLFSKIVAKKFNSLQLNLAQKGFRNIDGCLANALLLQCVIKMCRRRSRPYVVITLDLRKAFDTVSIFSIIRALRRAGVDPRLVRLVRNMYDGCSTRI